MFGIRSIQAKLFINYSLLIVSIIFIFVFSFYYYTARLLNDRASETIQQLANYISNQIDSEIETMDTAAIRVIYSNTVREAFFADLSIMSNSEILGNQRQLNDSLYTMMGPVFPFRQINLISLKGRFVGVGTSSIQKTLDSQEISQKSWIADTLAQDVFRNITLPHTDDSSGANKIIFSLTRKFSRELVVSQEIGIVEVQQDYDVLTQIIEKSIRKTWAETHVGEAVYIFDDQGNLIFPIADKNNGDFGDYYNFIQKAANSNQLSLFKNPSSGEEEILSFIHSDYSKWTIVIKQSNKVLLKPVNHFRNIMIIATFGILLITLFTSFFVAKGLTNPIKRIHKSISKLSFDTLLITSGKKNNSSLNELDDLDQSFKAMCARLDESFAEMLVVRSQEYEARMTALQAQMNPHFLYNTISTIMVMAQEDNNPKIANMCRNLVKMLRFILAKQTKEITLSDEIEYTLSYLHLMKHRYAEFLQFDVDMDPRILTIEVPKLIVQPLVENCLKFAIHIRPPWKIRITGTIHGHIWKIAVKDNGTGFESQVLEGIHKAIVNSEYESNNTETENHIGLLNIYTRLKLIYGTNVIFECKNDPDGGASVTIGGSFTKTTEENIL